MKMYLNWRCSKKIFYLFLVCLFIIKCHADDINASIEFSLPYNTTNGADEPFTPLVHFNGQTYIVWVDNNFRPYVTQKADNSSPKDVPLDSNSDYKAYNDGHHRFSMGIDKNGYLHIAGDMHGYPGGPGNNDYLPARYKKQTIMYWISNKPYDISGGFTFAGGKNASTAIPGTSFNTFHFFNDNNRELYFTAMVRAFNSDYFSGPGQLGVGLYKYDADKKVWNALGGFLDNSLYKSSDRISPMKVLFWEYAGYKSTPWFQNFWPSFIFDHNNNLHFAVSAAVNNNVDGPTRLLYAVSSDGGLTWSKANGKKIPGLPLRGIDSAANCADVVYDHGKKTTYMGPKSWVVADVEGNPCVTVNTEWYEDPVWRRWNGSVWSEDISNSHKCMGTTAYLGPDGDAYFFYYDRLRKTPALTAYSAQYNLKDATGLSSFICVSDIGLKNRNALYCIARKDNKATTMSIAKFSFKNYRLPIYWDSTDIGATMPLGGDADYYNGIYTMRSSGAGVQKNADNFHFAYTTLKGDGSIIARLSWQDKIRPKATDGIMIRESLDPNSKCFMLGSSLSSGKYFNYRNATGGNVTSINVWDRPGNWMKLTRKGHSFTAFVSADGINWTPVGTSQTIPMGQNVHAGLMSWSSEPLTEIHVATLDQVKVLSA